MRCDRRMGGRASASFGAAFFGSTRLCMSVAATSERPSIHAACPGRLSAENFCSIRAAAVSGGGAVAGAVPACSCRSSSISLALGVEMPPAWYTQNPIGFGRSVIVPSISDTRLTPSSGG